MEWSKEQIQAIEKTGANILVSASAGSGKTAVLVARIINKVVNQKIDIDKLLVVTFTNAAASEMKQRILDAIYEKIDENPNDEYLQKQILLLNRAHISTIHSFCLDVIRNNFFELGIPAKFRVADTAEIEIMKQEVIEDIFEEKYEEQNSDFLKLLELYTTYKDDTPLKEIILSIYDFTRCVPFPEKWLEEKIEEFNLSEDKDFSNTVWGKMLLNKAKQLIDDTLINLDSAKSKVANNIDLADCYTQLAKDYDDIANIKTDSWDNLYLGVNSKGFDRWSLKKKMDESSKELKDEAKINRDEAREIFEKQLKPIVTLNSKDAINDLKEMYPVLLALKNIVIEFTQEFEKRKREKNIVDFSDIEHMALKLLVNEDNTKTKIAEKYDFEEVLIDEYQDSNLVQEAILKSVSNGKNIFMVGDVKQSIYRFRQARPDLFLDKYEKYKKIQDSDENLKENTKIQLYNNYRSRENVLDITNQIFQNIMSKELGEIDYTQEEYLNFSGKFESPKLDCLAELNIIETKTDSEENDITENLEDDDAVVEKSVLEARFVAKRIKELEAQGINYKDMVILLRSTSREAPVYEKELLEQGIPVFSDTASEFLESIEINTILSLLKIIDNPLQDIPLVTVLRSPICGFTENELVEIRLNDTQAPYYNALVKTDTEKVKKFLQLVENLKKAQKELPLDELIWKIYSETGYYHYVRLMPNGKLRQANLKKLFEKAKDYEKISFKGLFNFINFIEKVSQNSSNMQEAKIIGENDDVVRIMSIHKSKGLEFPIVFLCGVDKKINLEDIKDKIMLDQELGLGVNYIGSGMEYPTLSKEAIKLKMKNEAISEDMRVLYVALTRAKEKLIIVSADKNVRESLEKKSKEIQKYKLVNNKINPKLVEKYIRYLDWMELVYLYNSNVKLKLEIIDRKTLGKYKKKEKITNDIDLSDIKIDEQKYKEIDKLLNWEYEFKDSIEVPSKTSVTALKEENINKTENLNQKIDNIYDNFERKKSNITGARLGTLIHLALQKIDNTFENIESLLEKLKITQEEKDALLKNKEIIENFVNSELFEDLKNAKEIHRETPFYMNIPYKDTKEKVLVQGIIDLYYVDKDGNIILVDYKTDRNVDENTLIERYKFQLNLYKNAIENSLNKKIYKVLIYSTFLNKSVELTSN